MNIVVLSGNLTRDPELRQTASGFSVLTFGIAVNERKKNANTGQWEDVPNYFDCTVLSNRAEGLSRYLNKGQKVALQGRLKWSQWERDGVKRSKVEVIAEDVVLMSQAKAREEKPTHEPSIYDTDIPF